MIKKAKKLKARKIENPMKWMKDDAFHAAVKDELQKFISSNDYIKVPKEYMSAVLLIAWHFAEWGKPQPSLPSNLDEAAEKWKEEHFRREYYQIPKDAMSRSFKAGAEWMAGLGETREFEVYLESLKCPDGTSYEYPACYMKLPGGVAGTCVVPEKEYKEGDKVVVQVRKKEE